MGRQRVHRRMKWKGVTAAVPSRKDLTAALQDQDLFV